MSTVTPTFHFKTLMRTISSISEKKNWQKSISTFLANEINATDRDVTGLTEQVQIMFPLKDKNINYQCQVFEAMGRR